MRFLSRLLIVCLGIGICEASYAQTQLKEDFTGTSNTLKWTAINGACLTASTNQSPASGQIPGCIGLPYYKNLGDNTQYGGYSTANLQKGVADPSGNGALRLTNAFGYERGAILSQTTFPSSDGISITFKSVVYGGNGADGMTFFLADASYYNSGQSGTGTNYLAKGYAPDMGASGGALGYGCSNGNPYSNGIVGAYIGLGMDEYQNYLNQSDNSASGTTPVVSEHIGLRGAGNVAWNWLNYMYPTYYPSSLSSSSQLAAVQNTCRTGMIWNYSGRNPSNTGTALPANSDYAYIPGSQFVLPASTPIANNSKTYSSAVRPATTSSNTTMLYNLKITPDYKLSLSYSYGGGTTQPVMTNQSIVNGTLPTNFVFGFTASTGGLNEIHEILCFQVAPASTADSSAAVNAVQGGQVEVGTQAYLASFHQNNWWGQLVAYSILYNPGTNTISLSTNANWDASCVLTGGACGSTSVATTAQSPANRKILTAQITSNTMTGVPFEWTNLSSTQQGWLNGYISSSNPGDSNGQLRLNFLRGDRSQEQTSSGSGIFRTRTSVLGDIYNSSPVVVGAPSTNFPTSLTSQGTSWKDMLYPTATMNETPYSAFQTANASRLNVAYAGANDGMLHGFETGNYVGGVYNSAKNDGLEVLAYVPNAVLQTIHNSSTVSYDYPSPQYSHNFFVDAPPGTGDLFYGGAWHTWLFGGLGAGGNAIYALDVTNPANFSETNASSLVIGEWSATNSTTLANYLGQTFGTPQMVRLHNGQWAMVFGNGLNSPSNHGGLMIGLVNNVSSGIPTVTFQFISLPTGYAYSPADNATTPNGIEYVTPVDLDGDGITDYVYAGDIKGNVWRFDLTSNNASNWSVTNNAPLFSAGSSQPITTKIIAYSIAGNNAARLILAFGTGQQMSQTLTAPTSYATGTQNLYGIWDGNMGVTGTANSGWNTLPNVISYYASFPSGHTQTVSSSLTTQTVALAGSSGNAANYRTITSNAVCWAGSTTCSSGNTSYGWTFAFPGTNEQLIFSPTLYANMILINTTIPATTSPNNCQIGTNTGWSMAINAVTGGALQSSGFLNANGNYVPGAGQIIAGTNSNAVGSPVVVSAGGRIFTVSNGGTTGTPPMTPQNVSSRVSWVEIR